MAQQPPQRWLSAAFRRLEPRDDVAFDEAFAACAERAAKQPSSAQPLAFSFLADETTECALVTDTRLGLFRGNGVDAADDAARSVADQAMFFSQTTPNPADARISGMALISVLLRDDASVRCDVRFKCVADDATCAQWRKHADARCVDPHKAYAPWVKHIQNNNKSS